MRGRPIQMEVEAASVIRIRIGKVMGEAADGRKFISGSSVEISIAGTQIDGAMPRLTEIPPGCAFNPRCDFRGQRCLRERPELLSAGASRAACWLHDRAGVGVPVPKERVDA